MTVALRKESVDRNYIIKITQNTPAASLSARRAWIEIVLLVNGGGLLRSLSARRAWIEINMLCSVEKCWAVALRKESVDRNLVGCINRAVNISRSPQGERG